MSQYYDWGSWAAIDTALAISNGADDTSDAQDLDGKAAAEVSVKAVYAAGTVTQGLKVYILRDQDGTDYEAEADLPWGFEMPYSSGGTYRKTFSVSPADMGGFKILVTNDSGVQVTVTTKIRTAVIGSA